MADPSYPEVIVAEIERLGDQGALSIVEAWIGQAEDLYIDFTTKEDPGTPLVGITTSGP
jgi:hypothetical protein